MFMSQYSLFLFSYECGWLFERCSVASYLGKRRKRRKWKDCEAQDLSGPDVRWIVPLGCLEPRRKGSSGVCGLSTLHFYLLLVAVRMDGLAGAGNACAFRPLLAPEEDFGVVQWHGTGKTRDGL